MFLETKAIASSVTNLVVAYRLSRFASAISCKDAFEGKLI